MIINFGKYTLQEKKANYISPDQHSNHFFFFRIGFGISTVRKCFFLLEFRSRIITNRIRNPALKIETENKIVKHDLFSNELASDMLSTPSQLQR